MAAQAAAIGEAALLAAGGWVALAELGEEDRPAVVLVREVVRVVEMGAGVAVMAKEAQPSGRRRAWQRRSD